MAENSKIEWTDHTFNPWIGCTKVSVGDRGACEHCYAEVATPARAMRIQWGPGKPRHRTSASSWAQPLKWERDAAAFQAEHGRRQRVFCASLADVFDNEVNPEWRADLFRLIRQTPSLDWLLLTKRIGNAISMIDRALTDGHLRTSREPFWPWPNLWLGATVASQEEVDREVPKLLNTPARVRFLSVEPMLGPIDIGDFDTVDWVICGGESGPKARPMHPDWARSLRDQCVAAGVPFFFKQWGEWIEVDGHLPTRMVEEDDPDREELAKRCVGFLSTAGHFVQSLADALPDVHYRGLARPGKKRAGRELDGRTWDEFPEHGGNEDGHE